MDTNLSNVPVAGPKKAKFMGIARGQEKFAFLYGVIAAVTVTCVVAYALIANLNLWRSLLLLTGCLLVGWAFVFHFLEMRRAARTRNGAVEAVAEEPDPYLPRTVAVAPPTEEPYPHHEDFPESAGFDQSQLTARIPGSTPFIDRFLDREEKQKASR